MGKTNVVTIPINPLPGHVYKVKNISNDSITVQLPTLRTITLNPDGEIESKQRATSDKTLGILRKHFR